MRCQNHLVFLLSASLGLAPAFAQAMPSEDWHLERISARAVWSAHRARGKEPGEGVTVAILDTGYTPHPELAMTPDATSPVSAWLGWDFVDRKQDPLDPIHTGLLKAKAHGTQLASLIVSPRGAQRVGDGASQPRGVWGVAPGARVVPYRVSESVVQTNFTLLSAGMRRATDDGADIILICMGGLRSRGVESAVDYARAHGVIVVAAAGNEVGFVAWPAAYKPSFAIAASTYADLPWSHSSRGSAVDLSAPGENVWTAFSKIGPDGYSHTVAPGSGTSMAAAVTAGAIALWISWHGKRRLEARYGPEGIAGALDRIIASGGATRTPGGWDGTRYGKGILDAWKLVNAPLPPP